MFYGKCRKESRMLTKLNNRRDALDLLERTGANVQKAADEVDALGGPLRNYLLRMALSSLLAAERHTIREAIKRPKEGPRFAATAKDRARLAETLSIMTSWRLANGTKLGNATKQMLHEEAEREASLADGHLQNQRFMEAILKGMGNHRTVRQAYTEAQLEAIKRRVWR
jgi:hypothetical protein